MTEQLQLRRGTAAQVAGFIGAQGELVVDTTNNRAVVNDGATAGGWPAAKLAEVVTNTRTSVSDAAYSAQTTDRLIAFTSLTAARTVSLLAAASYPTGTRLMVVDESGSCSAAKTITVAAKGSDLIDGATSFVIDAAYAGLEIESNGSNAWTILSPSPNVIASLVGIGTAPDPNNPLSAYGPAALFNNAANCNLTINKGGSAGASADTASLIFEDGFSGRAQMGLAGSDNFTFKVSPNGSTWTAALTFDATTGAATFANQRTAVADAAYAALVTDRLIAYAALTAARTVTLPSAATYPAGVRLTIADESGACSAADTITVAAVGSDTINGAASTVLSAAYAYVAVESNGSGKWTIVDASTTSSSSSVAAITSGTINGASIGASNPSTGAFTTLSLARHAVADAAYAVAAGVSMVAYTAITAARIVTLPAAASFLAGQQLLIADESGACSAVKTITAARAGTDTINGAASAVVATAYGYLCLESNGVGVWTIVDQNQVAMVGDSGSGGAAGYVPAPPSASAAYNEVLGAGGAWVGPMAGFRNRIINGACAIDQRNSGASQTLTASAALAYAIDRFYAYCTGANVAGQRIVGSAPDQYLYQFAGAASVTAIGFGQRIETANSFDLAGQTATLSVKLANSLLTTVTWSAYYATTADTFGTLASPTKTQIATGSFTVNSTLTRYQAQIAIPSAATTGIEIVLSVGAQTSGTWTIGEIQFELGILATLFERRPIGTEQAVCERYYELSYGGAMTNAANNSYFASANNYRAMKRVTPTVALASTVASQYVGTPYSQNVATEGFLSVAQCNSATNPQYFVAVYSSTAEL